MTIIWRLQAANRLERCAALSTYRSFAVLSNENVGCSLQLAVAGNYGCAVEQAVPAFPCMQHRLDANGWLL